MESNQLGYILIFDNFVLTKGSTLREIQKLKATINRLEREKFILLGALGVKKALAQIVAVFLAGFELQV